MSKDKRSADSGQRTDKLQELEQQVSELTEALQRERADSINLRRRVEEDRSKFADVYKAMVVRDFLPVIDNLERLLQHITTNSKEAPWKEGVEKIVKQAQAVLEVFGVKRIKTEGEVFDPRLHEAVSVDDSSEGDVEVVSQELQAGYILGDEVIRHAMVKVKMENSPESINEEKENENG